MADTIDGLAETADSDELRIGPYRLVARIGAGGMGEVWRAHDEILRRDLAVKVMTKRTADAEARERVLREARAQAALNHPHVCTVFQAGEDASGAWIAMELLAGPTLAHRVQQTRPTVAQTIAWCGTIAEALTAAHAIGLVHRDLKPANVMFAANGDLKLVDFGLVKRLAADDSRLDPTETGEIMGTPRYMSPEQAAGKSVTAPTDIFALGIVMYELLAGTPPFTGDTPMEMMAAIIRDEPKPLAGGIPHELAALVMRCLSRDPAARPDAASVRAELERMRSTTQTATAVTERAPRRWLPLTIAGGIVALGAVIAVAALRGGHDTPVVANTARDAGPRDAVAADARPHADAIMPTVDNVDAAAFAPDGKTLMFIANDRLWMWRDGKPQELVRDVKRASSVACCVRGKLIARGDDDVVLVDPATLAVERFDAGPAAFIAPDGTRGITSDMHELALVDVPSGEHRTKIATARAKGIVFGVSWSPDGSQVAYLDEDHDGARVYVFDPATKVTRELATVNPLITTADPVVWQGNGILLVADQRDGDTSLLAIEVTTGKQTQWVHWTGRTVGMRSAGAHTIAYLELRTLNDVLVGELPAAKLAPIEGAFVSGGWLDDGRMVLGDIDVRAHTFDLVAQSIEGKPTMVLPGNDTAHFLLGVAGDRVLYAEDRTLWSVDLSGRDRLDLGVFGSLGSVACGGGRCVVFEHEGQDVVLRDLDVKGGARKQPFARFHADPTTLDGSVSPDGQRVAIGEGKGIAIVDRRTGTIAHKTLPGLGTVMGVELTADPAVMFVTDIDHVGGATTLLRVVGDRAQVLRTDGNFGRPRVDRDGKHLMVGRERSVQQLFVEPLP